jgi:uncharacterized protein
VGRPATPARCDGGSWPRWGFLDAVGGGGWGPVATPTLLTAGRLEPRLVIGSVSASELLVTLAASAGFLVGIGGEGIQASLVLALLVGGVIAAPLAAWLVHHSDASALGVVVGMLLLATNARLLMLELDTPGPVRFLVIVCIAAAGATLALRTSRESRAAREAAAAEPEAEVAADAELAVEPEVMGSVGSSARS